MYLSRTCTKCSSSKDSWAENTVDKMASQGLTLLSQWLIRGVARVQCSEGTLKSSFTGLGYCFQSSARPFAPKVIFLYHTLPFTQLCKRLCTCHASSSSVIPAQGASVTPSCFPCCCCGCGFSTSSNPCFGRGPFCAASWSVTDPQLLFAESDATDLM